MGRTLRFLLLQMVLTCGYLIAAGEVCALQVNAAMEDSLRIDSRNPNLQMIIESDAGSFRDAVQHLQWNDWQWIQPLGINRDRLDSESMHPSLRFGQPDSLLSLPYAPLDRSAQWSIDEQDTDWIVVGNPYREPVQLGQFTGVGGEIQSTVGYLWDREKQQFRAVSGRSFIEPGDVIALKNRDAERVELPVPTVGPGAPGSARLDEERSIQFTLFNRISPKHSEVHLHFEHEATAGMDPFDLESIYSGLEYLEFPDTPRLFFQGVGADSTYWLSRDARPFELESPMELTMGFLSRRDSGPHRLEWELAESVPEDWTLELTDRWTRQKIDLRQRQSYRFDGDGAVLAPLSLAHGEIQSLLLEEPHERFQVRIAPRDSEQGGPSLHQVSQDPDKMELHANYPNPFSAETSVEFFLPEETVVYLHIYNVVGQRVAQLINGDSLQGWHTETWNAGDLPSGIYILRLETPRGVLTRKMTLIR